MAARAKGQAEILGGGRGGGYGQGKGLVAEQGAGRWLHDKAQRDALPVQPIHLVNNRFRGGAEVFHVHLES